MIDYQEIIESLDDSKVLELMMRLGVTNYKETENYFIFPTICHNEDIETASLKLYYYKNTKLFYCYTECGAMSIFKLLRKYYEVRGIEYDWHTDILEAILNCSNFIVKHEETYFKLDKDKYIKQNEIILPEYKKEVLDTFIHYYPIEWLNDGITKAAMDKFNILFSPIQNKIIIPHYDINGRLVGIRGRALNEEEAQLYGKYMPVKIENQFYTHKLSLNLYGLNFNKDNIRKNKIAYIFESEKSVMQVENFKMDNCAVAVCGSNLTKFQIKLLLKYCKVKEIVLCFDNEEKENEDKYFKKLQKIGQKYKNYCNVSFIYDFRNILNLKDSPSDKGEEVFKSLLDRRVYVK